MVSLENLNEFFLWGGGGKGLRFNPIVFRKYEWGKGIEKNFAIILLY
jgi:hypothetical protein